MIERLIAGLDRSDPAACWVWTGPYVTKGKYTYGRISSVGAGGKKVKVYVHRLAYRYWIGAIPDGSPVSQSCGNSLCCQPLHLVAQSMVRPS